MSPLLGQDAPSAEGSLRLLAATASDTLAARRRGLITRDELVERLWTTLDSGVDVLLRVATDLSVESKEARPLLEGRDAIAINLRAATDLDAADARPELRTDLLVRAAELLIQADLTRRCGPTRAGTP